MADLIDRYAALEKMCNDCKSGYDGPCPHPFGMCHECESILQVPTIEPEVRHGRWVHHNGGYSDHFECTACGEDIVLTGKWRFCPNCGARMDGVIEYEGH